ncbi:branched-chain amino acid ABC transporter permease [Limnochorda pilosa]|uniref:Branched-chain amino acid ABC transporter permease n=1 Tax=Limnochorda pilosa TaxID=1555112 RepID=A0A0K2SKV4_LIMPI|nr:branched-chain amino acid ABC transporter permease [Limnochorda pilosa]
MVLGVAAPWLVSDYWVDVAVFWGIYALLGLSLNLIVGEVGLFNMGHTAFFAIGAYATVILNQAWGLSLWLLIPVAGFLAAAAGYGLSRPIIHLRGDYLLIATIGLNEILRVALLNNPRGLTGGPNGVILLDQFRLFGYGLDRPERFYYLVWGAVGLVVWGLLRLQRSRIGRAWNCVREDEVAAEAMGIDVRQAKLLAFVLGAGLAGAAGTLFAAKMVVVSPDSFTFMEAVILFAIVILGGMGSIPGVLVGSAAMMVLPELLRNFAQYRMLFFGAAMVVMMIFRPQGLWPSRRWKAQLAGEREP